MTLMLGRARALRLARQSAGWRLALLLCCGTGLLLFDAAAAQAQGIIAHSPVTNAVGVAVTANITASFDATVDAATVTTRTFTVRSSFRGLYTATATVSGSGLTLDPSRDFFTGEQVQVVGTAAISSTGGAPLNPTQWGFTAGPVKPRCLAGFMDSGQPMTPSPASRTAAWRGGTTTTTATWTSSSRATQRRQPRGQGLPQRRRRLCGQRAPMMPHRRLCQQRGVGGL